MQEQIREKLIELADEKYKTFHSTLCPNTQNILGVRIPMLRKLAKELIKKIDVEEYLQTAKQDYYEEIMLQGMIIGMAKMPFKEKMQYIKAFIPKIDNWAVCDTFCSGLKEVKKHKEEFWQFILPYIASTKEFEVRFAVVCMMDYYLEKEKIQEIFGYLEQIKEDKYYIKMAVAWLLSVAIVKLPEETMHYLQRSKLDNWTYNKAIQKMIESYRISDETKENLRRMKR